MRAVKSLWIIDDDKIYRFTTEKYLQMLKLADQVSSFSDGEEALNMLKSYADNKDNLPDIILLDVNMPIMDGWDFIDEFSEMVNTLPKNITVYMVSSSIDSRDMERAQSIQTICEFVIKPISEQRLIELVETAGLN